MKRNIAALTAMAFAVPSSAFAPLHAGQNHHRQIQMATEAPALKASSLTMAESELPFFLSSQLVEEPATNMNVQPSSNMTPKTPRGSKHNEGPLSPIVLLAKDVLGDKTLNKVRAKAIALHSDVIAAFVDSADSNAGKAVLETLFQLADKNDDGIIEEEELAEALQWLGFDWLKEKQVKGILKRADANENGAIDIEEWLAEAPKTLRTNLIKLAKKNGGQLGLLV